MIKNRLILTGIFIEMGVIEIEYELNKIKVFTKIDEEPHIPGIGGTMATGLSTLVESYLFYRVKRYDFKGKQHLATQKKYYLVVLGFRHALLGKE